MPLQTRQALTGATDAQHGAPRLDAVAVSDMVFFEPNKSEKQRVREEQKHTALGVYANRQLLVNKHWKKLSK